MSNLLSTRLTRGFAAGVATIVGAAGLTVASATVAQAAPTGSLTWGISEQFFDHLSTRVPGGGVTVDATAKTFTFPEEETSVAGGVTTIDYAGSIRSAFVMGPTEYYHVMVEDPTVVIAASGQATISATVSSAAPAQGANPAEVIAPVEVSVVTLPTTGDLAGGFSATQGTDFNASFFDGLAAGVEAHFKQTSTATPPVEQPKKRPAGFVAQGTEPAVVAAPTVTAATTKTATGHTVAVTGTNFASDNAAYSGIYVGVAKSGGLPDVTSQAGRTAFLDSELIWKEAIVGGAVNASLTVKDADLVAGQSYSVYTWMAHTHASTELDTVTNLGVLKAKTTPPTTKPTPPVVTKAKAKVKLKWAKKSTAKKAGKVKVTVAKASGKAKATGKAKVTIKIKGKKKAKTFTVRVKAGAASVKAPKRTQKVTVKYLGDRNYKAATKAIRR